MKISRMRFIAVLCIVLVALVSAQILVSANTEHRLQFYFSPQVMDDTTGDIVIDLKIRNYDISVPNYLGGMCGFNLAFEYDTNQFDVIKNENGNAIFTTDENTLVKKASDIEVKTADGRIDITFIDMTLGENLIDRDGTLCRFTLKSKNPRALWNSIDYYPIRFVPGSVGIVTYDIKNFKVGRFEKVEAIDGRVGGYNTAPNFILPEINKTITFTADSSEIIVNGETVPIDAVPFINNNEWMVPVRFLSENIGMQVEWDGDVMTASAYADYKTLKISIKEESPLVYVNSARCYLATSPVEANGRIYIPLEVVTRLYPDAEITTAENQLTIVFK